MTMPKSRLYIVEVAHKFVIEVQEGEDPQDVANVIWKDAINTDPDILVEVEDEVTTVEQAAAIDYTKYCIPWSSDFNNRKGRTEKDIGQILEEQDFGTKWNKRMDELGAERGTIEDLNE